MLPIISKIMERIVHDQLYKFIEENNILNKWQSGFRPGYSTETAMTYVTDLSPVHTSDAVEKPTVGGTNIHAYEYLTGSYSGV